MKCLHCGLFNPPSALRCDCGYDFQSGQFQHRDTIPGTGAGDASRRSSELTAFLIVPFVATISWYVLMLCALAVGNGRLRWRTDVLAMALGAMIVGLPAAVAITLILAIPVYLLIRRTVGITLARVLAGGGGIGLCAALAFWMLAREWTVLSPVRGVLIGVTTAVGWWYVAGRPNQVSDKAA
jgi:hypothetical protein